MISAALFLINESGSWGLNMGSSPFPQPPEGSGEEKIPPSIVLVETLKI